MFDQENTTTTSGASAANVSASSTRRSGTSTGTAQGGYAAQMQALSPGASNFQTQQASLSATKQRSTALQSSAEPIAYAEQSVVVDDPLIQEIQQLHPDGFTMSIWADYPRTGDQAEDNNNNEFRIQGRGAAQRYNTVASVGGQPQLDASVAIRSKTDIEQAVMNAHVAVQSRYEAVKPPGAPADVRFGKVKNLMIFCHGLRRSLHLPGENVTQNNVESFVQGISSATLPNVNVQLYACSTATVGDDYFASVVAETLGDEASVFGHTTAAHTTENHEATAFGAIANGAADGIAMQDVLFPASFVDSEVVRIWGTIENPETATRARNTLQSKIRTYYARIAGLSAGWRSRERQGLADDIPGEGGVYGQLSMMGREMFINPDRARTLAQSHFQEWIAGHRNTLGRVAPLSSSFG